MSLHLVKFDDLNRAAQRRPPGYREEVLSKRTGPVVEGGFYVTLDDYNALRAKYRSLTPRRPAQAPHQPNSNCQGCGGEPLPQSPQQAEAVLRE